jgi:Primase C terminal 1 (PriCT-1)
MSTAIDAPRGNIIPMFGRAATEAFLQTLDPGETEFTFQTFDDTAAKRRELARVLHGSLEQHWSTLQDLNSRGAGVFVTVNRTDLKGRRKENIVGTRALFVDFDNAPLENIKRLSLSLHICLATSQHGGGYNFHVYWRVNGIGLDEFESIQARLAKLMDSDPAICDLPRVMRLPGFLHQKEAPFPVQGKSWPDRLPYSRDEFLKALAEAEARSNKPGTVHIVPLAGSGREVTAASVACGRATFDMDKDCPEGQRNQSCAKCAGHLLAEHGRNLQPDEARAELHTWNQRHCKPPLDEAEVDRTFESIASAELQKRVQRAPRVAVDILSGQISSVVDRCEEILLDVGAPLFVRQWKHGRTLVSPIPETVDAVGGGRTVQARFQAHTVVSLKDRLNQHIDFRRWDGRSKQFRSIDPPKEVADILLSRAEGTSGFPLIEGIIATPTLRPDGSLLDKPGYDPETQLYLAIDESFILPSIDEEPTREQALEALALLEDLLDEFPFVSRVDRAVGLSAIVTATLRGMVDVVPMHAIRAHESGTGKGYLVHLASVVATGQKCASIAAGESEAELEKRLGAILREGASVVSIDNVNRELGGEVLEMMCSETEMRVRTLGLSEAPKYKCRVTPFATGNNLKLTGDLPRRSLLCHLDAKVERPEKRKFELDPLAMVQADRQKYVAAVLTIARAYRTARGRGEQVECSPLNGYHQWSRCVREALIWLGCADPVESQERVRSDDPTRNDICALFANWPSDDLLFKGELAATQLISAAEESDSQGGFKRPELRELLLRVAYVGQKLSSNKLGQWFVRIEGRVVDGKKLMIRRDAKRGNRYYLADASIENGGGKGEP